MARTLEQMNRDFLIEQYLNGRPLPRRAPLQAQADQWLRALIDDPDLDLAEDIIDAAMPAYAPVTRRSPGPPARELPAPKPGLWKSISNIVFYVALAAIVVGAIIVGDQSRGSLKFLGYQSFKVMSPSMQSMIPQGSVVVTKETPSKDIQVGDVITYLRSDETNITHQVVEVVPDFDGRGSLGFRTKGTENADPDPDIVGAANVLGVVKLHIGGLGFTLNYISDNIKYVFLIFIFVILLSIAVRVWLGERKKARVQQPGTGCSHNKRGREKSRPDERMDRQCKRQPQAA